MEKRSAGDDNYPVLAFRPSSDGTLILQTRLPQLGRLLDSLWQSYRSWVRENESLLMFSDEMLGRLVLVPVHFEVAGYNFRHVVFLILEVHRMLVQVAVCTDSFELNGFSTSLAIPATNISRAIRAGLIILKAMGPIVQELEPSKEDESRKRQLRIPAMVILQRFRFAFRFTLLVNYWFLTIWDRRAVPGILLEGGLLGGSRQTLQFFDICLSKESTHARYRGCRTGLHIPPRTDTAVVIKKIFLLLAEAVNIMRPFLLVECESVALPRSKQWRAWKTSLCLDFLSLSSLHFCGLDSVGRQEWERRRWRLVLYMLRSPMWETHMLHHLERFSRVPGWRVLCSYIEYWRLFRNDE